MLSTEFIYTSASNRIKFERLAYDPSLDETTKSPLESAIIGLTQAGLISDIKTKMSTSSLTVAAISNIENNHRDPHRNPYLITDQIALELSTVLDFNNPNDVFWGKTTTKFDGKDERSELIHELFYKFILDLFVLHHTPESLVSRLLIQYVPFAKEFAHISFIDNDMYRDTIGTLSNFQAELDRLKPTIIEAINWTCDSNLIQKFYDLFTTKFITTDMGYKKLDKRCTSFLLNEFTDLLSTVNLNVNSLGNATFVLVTQVITSTIHDLLDQNDCIENDLESSTDLSNTSFDYTNFKSKENKFLDTTEKYVDQLATFQQKRAEVY